MELITAEYELACPKKPRWLDEATTAVNAAAIVTGVPWQDLVRCLMEQAHLRNNMPTYKTCVTDMLRVNGLASRPAPASLGQLLEDCRTDPARPSFVVKLRYRSYYALVPSGTDDCAYVIKGCTFRGSQLSARADVEELWQFEPGTDNRTGITRRGFRRDRRYQDHKEFTAVNVNPGENYVGDCAVRALCTVLERTWHEAIDLLAEVNEYIDPGINSTANINAALIHLGLERNRAMRRNGLLMSGKDFCDQMTYTYHNGERIFAYVGRSHCAAILPFREPDGTVRYKIQDTWDSTSHTIGDYWVYAPKETKKAAAGAPRAMAGDLSVGSALVHPQFGEGTVVAVNGNVIEAEFPSVGVKKIARSWLMKNC